ncbi:MAG TPA: hypothetical protein VMR52_13965 [Dehalococcoidia bacterium]|nr:hypothetical protein [Dehalococcoidia bacterium]
MSGSDPFVQSLRNRIRAMNIIWERAVSDMTLDQMNHHEREGVLPIAFSFTHYIQAQDQSASLFFRKEPPLWVRGGWAEKTGVSINALGREETVNEMQNQRIGDLDAWKAYQAAVIAQTDEVLDSLTADLLLEVIFPQLPPNMQNIFCAIVIGPGSPLRKLDVLECFVYQHGLRHMGEVEHGRALVGLGGMTS